MREHSAVQSILVNALRLAREANASQIKSLQLALGEIAELDQASIQAYWKEVSTGTPAEHAELRFRLIQAEVQCMACFVKYTPQNGKIHCPACGSYGAKVLSGEEFHLESIELES